MLTTRQRRQAAASIFEPSSAWIICLLFFMGTSGGPVSLPKLIVCLSGFSCLMSQQDLHHAVAQRTGLPPGHFQAVGPFIGVCVCFDLNHAHNLITTAIVVIIHELIKLSTVFLRFLLNAFPAGKSGCNFLFGHRQTLIDFGQRCSVHQAGDIIARVQKHAPKPANRLL